MSLNKICSKAATQITQSLSKPLAGAQKGLTDAIASSKLQNELDNLCLYNKSIVNNKSLGIVDEAKQAITKKIEQLRSTATGIKTKNFTLTAGAETKFQIFDGTQVGTNIGYYGLDVTDGKLYYVKYGSICPDKTLSHIPSQAENEVLASKLYELAGVDCAKMQVALDDSAKKVVLSEYIPNLSPISECNKGVIDGLGADIWLGNWDVICSNNIQMTKDKCYRIDFGGALEYRSLGELKNKLNDNFDIECNFGVIVQELSSMFDPNINRIRPIKNLSTNLTREDLIASLRKITTLDDEKIRETVLQNLEDKKSAQELADILIKRKTYLHQALDLIEQTPKEKDQSMFEYLQGIQKKVNSCHYGYTEKLESSKPIQFTQEELNGIAQDEEMQELYDYYISHYKTLPLEEIESKDTFHMFDSDGLEFRSKSYFEKKLLEYTRPTLKQACQRYQGFDEYKYLNEHLRSGELEYSEKVLTDCLNRLFDKKGIGIKQLDIKDGILYRGVDADCSWLINGKNTNIQNLKIGDIFTEAGFVSTSKNQKIAQGYAAHGYMFKIIPSDTTKVLDVTSITQTSTLREEEILLRNNTTFKVVDIKDNVITLKALN